MKKILLLSFAVFLALSSALVRAEDEAPAADEKEPVRIYGINADFGRVEDNYVETSYENLSRLYWAIGKLDMQNDKDIDNFLLINECDIYQQYINNDIEWANIRNATREKILGEIATYPTRFEIMIPLYLDRYDLGRKVFDLDVDSKIINATNIDFAENFLRDVCDQTSSKIDNYPQNLILILSKPLTITNIPVEPGLAEAYIQDTSNRFKNLPKNLQVSRYERVAYLRLKVRVAQYKESKLFQNRYLRAVVFAIAEGYEIYADPEKYNMLYREDLDVMKGPRRVKKVTEDTPDQEN